MFFSTRTAKKSVANYILELRKKEATFRQAVARILAENNVKTAPIPVVSIARNLAFSVYAMAFKDETISGIMADSFVPVSPFQEKRVIVYNREDYPPQQHFTVAHEIAHFVLHCNTVDNFYQIARKTPYFSAGSMSHRTTWFKIISRLCRSRLRERKSFSE